MKSPWFKRILFGLAAVAVIALLAWSLREQPALVDVAEVKQGPMKVTIREEGVTRVREVYAVSAPIAGQLSRTLLNEGDRVKAGETVVAAIHPLAPPLIDRRTEAELLAARDAARSGVGIAESELQRAETALRLAETELGRALKLAVPGVISESALHRATNEFELQKAAVEAAKATVGFRRAELASAEARLMQPGSAALDAKGCCVDVLAPVDGVVLAVAAKSEQAVAAGARIADIGNTTDLEIVADLLSADAVRIGPGTKALVRDWGGERSLEATVRRVDPAAFTKVSALGIEEQRVNTVLDLDEGDGRLGHGYRVFVELAIWECADCLQVPISALFRNGSDWNVFLLTGDRVKQTAVEIGHMNDEVAQILGGVTSGDIVVLHPADTLADNSRAERRE
ncbi:HlyD family efflux transporter periplasmic adaptor subunit [Chelativorans sp. AA-79]|uniref:efflux RND transporter periplasmic adaptor subunit n=1 Tax=Chelativorans sp. AA-79 TaxID=3028735 RepID=UPI0023F96B15|nr:HlyD family efflux transporter periplasmic adaptor subunit [Chelativorans sp. AA-79]WEX10793.1 HlyD family efflux transporter periplasmic adaptor subunit [Chelativorans sp. AA-79]